MNVVLSSFYGFQSQYLLTMTSKCLNMLYLNKLSWGDIMNFHVIQSIKDEYYDKAITFYNQQSDVNFYEDSYIIERSLKIIRPKMITHFLWAYKMMRLLV